MELAGAFIVEIAELDALIRATNSASKGFLGRRWDKFRPPYGKHTINQQRQCVFAGTINPPSDRLFDGPDGRAPDLAGHLRRHGRPRRHRARP